VKNSDIGANAVTGAKVKDRSLSGADLADGSITGADIAAGVFQSDIADVTGQASGGPSPLPINSTTTIPVPLNGTTTFTPSANQVSALAAEAQFDVATTNTANQCSPDVILLVNGQPTRVFLSPDQNGPPFSTTLVTLNGNDADGPFGLISPGQPLTVTAVLRGDFNGDCTASSKLDRVEVRILQIH
jgi:hypothetical protein